MADFHLVRPLWLLLLLALPALYLIRHQLQASDAGWGRYIPEPLLRPLIRKPGQPAAGGATSSPMLPLYIAIVIIAVALAGPSWRQAPTAVKQPGDSLVIVLDLSLSMLATDSEPDRLTLAKRKIRDILRVRNGGLTGLVVYARDAHAVTPLTEDTRTIEALIGVLTPEIMPAQGNRADLAIAKAVDLLDQGAPGRGRVLLIADGVASQYQSRIRDRLANTGYTLSTLVVGSTEGGPIPLAKRGFLRSNGDIVVARADPAGMRNLARNNGGTSEMLSLGDADITALQLEPGALDDRGETGDDRTVNRWQDDGYWLLWLALPLLLIGWRRGALAILTLSLIPLSLAPRPALAVDWGGLWQREDQRGRELIDEDPSLAAKLLEKPDWRGAALYRSGQYDEAVRDYTRVPGATGHYNRGNALARSGQLEQAVAAYDQALALDPGLEDARFNRELVQQMLDQQQAQEQQQQEPQDQGQQEGSQPDNAEGEPSPDRAEDAETGQPEEGSGQGQDDPDSGQPQGSPSPGEDEDDHSGQPDAPDQQEQGTGQEPSGEDQTAGGSTAEAPAQISEQPLDQGQEQWLRRIPDNPGGLLQRKFMQQYQQRQTPPEEGDLPW